MYFKASGRTNPKTNRHEGYYKLVESYRNSIGRVCHRTILNVGFLEDLLTAGQLNIISRSLTAIYERKQTIFNQTDPLIQKWITRLWSRIVQIRYNIILTNDAKKNKNVIEMVWTLDELKNETKIEELGKYFLRTSLDMKDEVVVWIVCNTIREMESTFRTLNTDLDLRPIYHKSDKCYFSPSEPRTIGLFVSQYNPLQTKSNGIRSSLKEILRIENTQKVITKQTKKSQSESVLNQKPNSGSCTLH